MEMGEPLENSWKWNGFGLKLYFFALKATKYAEFCGNGMEMGAQLKMYMERNGFESGWMGWNGMGAENKSQEGLYSRDLKVGEI